MKALLNKKYRILLLVLAEWKLIIIEVYLVSSWSQ